MLERLTSSLYVAERTEEICTTDSQLRCLNPLPVCRAITYLLLARAVQSRISGAVLVPSLAGRCAGKPLDV